MSRFEKQALMTGAHLIVAGVLVAVLTDDAGGPGRALGLIGLGVLALHAASRGIRLYHAGTAGSLPRSVGRVEVRIRPRRLSTMTTVTLALVLPAALVLALAVLVEWGWLALAGMLLFGCAGLLAKMQRDSSDERPYWDPTPAPQSLLERLCIRADIRVPELVVEPGPVANAWTTGGRIHLTKPLLRRLDESELEAVLAHELAHLAQRDAAVMDVCSAPSRMLLGYAAGLVVALKAYFRDFMEFFPGLTMPVALLAAVSVPPAYLLGWVTRLSVLHMSRAREFAADAAAATLTGRPSALASALVKLDQERAWIAGTDLRVARARAVLCIVGSDSPRFGRLFSSHPATAARVKRLQVLEERVQSRGRAVELDG